MVKIKYKNLSAELKKLAEPNINNSSRSSIGMDQDVGEFYYLPVDKLIPYHKQIRVVFDDDEINSMAQTIKKHGVRQPLTIIASDIKPGAYEIVSGERRYRAARLIGLEKIPCIIIKEKEKAEEIALIENIQRSNLHPIELGRAYKSLLLTLGEGSQRVLASKLGIAHSSVSDAIALNELPDDVVNKILNENIRNRELLRLLLRSKSLEKMKTLLGMHALSPNETPKIRPTSVLRILLTNGVYKIQKKSLSKLNVEQKKLLKKHLIELLESL